MNNSPIYNALSGRKDILRFHMPGHMGKMPYGFDLFELDTTETYATGNLFDDTFPFNKASETCAEYFGVADAIMSTNGSSGALMACIKSVCTGKDIIIDRNCHKSVLNAIALLDLTPHFIYPDILSPVDFTANISSDEILSAFENTPENTPVLITSPNYYGLMQNIASISEICREHNRLLLIDEAHGAHFPAIGIQNAINQGANLAVTSAHKTLPSLTGGALILSDGTIPRQKLLENLSVFNSSSPSYPIMCSIEQACEYMKSVGKQTYLDVMCKLADLREKINTETDFFALINTDTTKFDPLRLTISTIDTGFTGHSLSQKLFDNFKICAEMSDIYNVVFIVTGFHTQDELDRLFSALSSLSQNAKSKHIVLTQMDNNIPRMHLKTSVRSAYFSQSKTICLENAVGEICAKPITPYPPGVPILYPGEEITTSIIEFIVNKCYNVNIREIEII